MTFLAILRDSMRETLDRRTTTVLVILSTAFVGLCATATFERRAPEEVYRDIVEDLETPLDQTARSEDPADDPRIRLVSIRPVSPDDRLPPQLAGGHRLLLSIGNPVAFAARVRACLVDDHDPTNAEGEDYIQDRLIRRGVTLPLAFTEAASLRFRVFAKVDDWDCVSRGVKVSFLFGAVPMELRGVSFAHAIVRIQFLLAAFFAGFLGMLVAVIVTAGSVPEMLRRGSADLVMTRPLSRVRLLLYKYVGGLLFVLLHATYFIGGTWAALAWRSGWWNPGYLGCILVLVGVFAILYSVSLAVGVVSRSAVPPILATLGLWFTCIMLAFFQEFLRSGRLGALPEGIERCQRLVYLLLPKAWDLGVSVMVWFLAFGRDSVVLMQDLELDRPMDLPLILGSSGAFVLLVLALACWVFSRRDY